jgi:hypothetical protein
VNERSANLSVFAAMSILGIALQLAQPIAAQASNSQRIEAYVDAVRSTLSENERAALARMPDPARQLLALRAYLRSGANLKSRWSWTDEQIRSFEKSNEYEQLRSAIDAITREFERRNSGYTLYANTRVRSLDTQIERWNSNAGVARTAQRLYEAAGTAMGDLPQQPDRDALSRFQTFLKSWRPSPTSPLAAPGLSMHGQSRAIDFQIMKDGKIVAATEVGAVAQQWDAPGWTRKLKEAIAAASPRFKGPLTAPNEPWHYEYLGGNAP